MKKLFINLCFFIPLLLLVMFVNYSVDMVGLFKSKEFEMKMADALLEGSNITDLKIPDFDDRMLQKFWIEKLKAKRDIAVFGSSRAMLISEDLFPGKTLLNNSVSAAALEDYISLYQIYREQHLIPSTIIIGVDHWIFNKNNFLFRWKALDKYYSEFMRLNPSGSVDLKLRIQDYVSPVWQQLFSFSYFQDNINFLRTLHFKLPSKDANSFVQTKSKWNSNQTILASGAYTWSENRREMPVAKVRSGVEDTIAKDVCANSFGFIELDRNLKQKFVNLVQIMKKDGVKVVIFLPPFHPLAYDAYMHSNKCKIINDVEVFLRSVAKTYDLTVVGSYDPKLFSLSEADFYDEMHFRDGKLNDFSKIFRDVIK
jgi:hypothetical protein